MRLACVSAASQGARRADPLWVFALHAVDDSLQRGKFGCKRAYPDSADTLAISRSSELKVPHMGWNEVTVDSLTPLTLPLPPEPRFYFVHSYYVRADDPADVMLSCHYGQNFDAGLNRGNLFGAQFHPEKSHKFGIAMLRGFAEISC